jgi:arabinose-5-phosphate isomerase
MHTGPAVPLVLESTPMPEVIHEMSRKRLGMTCVVDESGRLRGVVTDGDLRRHMTPGSNLLERTAGDVMTTTPVTIGSEMFAVEGLRLMEQRKITALVVVDAGRVEGVVHLHDLWRTQMI